MSNLCAKGCRGDIVESFSREFRSKNLTLCIFTLDESFSLVFPLFGKVTRFAHKLYNFYSFHNFLNFSAIASNCARARDLNQIKNG